MADKRKKAEAPVSIEEARKMARIKAVYAAPLWGLPSEGISKRCIRDDIPSAVKIGRDWYVTPEGLDQYFERNTKSKRGVKFDRR